MIIILKKNKSKNNKKLLNIIKKSGSWFSYGETRLGQGRDSVKGIIKDNPELMEELEQKIKDALSPSVEVDLVEEHD